MFAAIPGVAEFKVWPNQYSQTDAEYFFSDSYKTRAVDTPVWSVKGTPELNNGILSVKMIAKENIVDGQMYMSSLDVTMYKQYTSSSDYFSIKSSWVNTDWILQPTLTELRTAGLLIYLVPMMKSIPRKIHLFIMNPII